MQPDTLHVLQQTVTFVGQHWWVTLLFFALGHLGFVIRIFWTIITSGQKKLSVVDDYIEENSLVIVFGLLCYYAVVALWLWTDALSLLGSVGESFGLVPKILNGWTVVIAIVADVILMKIIDKFGDRMGLDKLSDKVTQVVPKFSKPTDPPAGGTV